MIIFNISLFSAGKQIQLNNGMWQAVGFQGVYKLDQKSTTWESDFTRAIQDIADDNVTYIKGDIISNDNVYSLVNNSIGTKYVSNTSQLNATLGLFAIKGKESRKNANFLILDGTPEHSVFFKTEIIRDHRYSLPRYRMYVEGKDDIPTIRIDYQSDYEGHLFRIKFGNEKESYVSYFNSSKTYSNPADLYDEEKSAIVEKGPIEFAMDFNISDNNITLLEQNRFRVRNIDFTVGGDGIKTFDSDIGDELLIYHYDSEKWRIFNSNNVNIGSNDFSDFEPGKGYWIKANSLNAHNDLNVTKIGIITKNRSDLLNSDYYSKLKNGWNMVSFPNTYLRYATTGMFIPYSDINSSGVNIFFGQRGQDKLVDTNSSRDINITLTADNIDTVTDVVQAINAFVKLRELLYGEPIKARAFPAMSDTNDSYGVIILATSKFEINSTVATTLTGMPLKSTTQGLFSTVYGEYVLGLELNDLSNSEINGSIDFFMPSSNERKFHATGISANDINITQDEKQSLITKFDISLKKAVIPVGSTNSATSTKSYLIDFDFESNESKREYNVSNNYRNVLITAGDRFFVRDETYTKVYHIENNGSFIIRGDNDERVLSGKMGVGNTGLGVVDSINLKSKITNIKATKLGDNYFMISSSTKRNLDLLEDDKKTLFIDTRLNDLNIPRDTVHYTKGVITQVYTFLNMLTPEVNLVDLDYFTGTKNTMPKNNTTALKIGNIGYDSNNSKGIGTYVTSSSGFPSVTPDLKENSMWAIDFPSDGILEKLADNGKEFTSIMTMNYSSDNDSYWSFIDLTKSPDTWYIQNGIDIQDIFYLYNQRAYWVNVRDKTFISESLKQIDVAQSVYQKQVVTHFDNTLVNGLAKTTNHIDHTLDIKFNKNFIDPTQNPYYDVLAIIAGEEYRMKYNGAGFQIRINSSTINLNEKNSTEPYDAIIIKAYDGLGNNFLETPKKHLYQIEYFKPNIPTLRWDKDGELVVNVEAGNSIEFYNTYVSDLEFERNNNRIKLNILSKNTGLLGWKATEGGLKKLRVVGRQSTTHNQSFYSDVIGFLYAPLKYGHVLSVYADKGKPKIDLIPYSFIQKQVLTSVDIRGRYPRYNGLNGINNGVQLTLLKRAIDLNNNIKMVYFPIIDSSGVKEGDKKLTSFGGNYTMYLRVSTPNDTEARPIAQITYIHEYTGQTFYIYYDGSLYQGVFQDKDDYNSDRSSYNLYSGTKGISFDEIGNEGNKIGFSTNSRAPSQPIVDPSSTPKNENNNVAAPTSPPLP
jgi:hypothetical protein